MYADHTHFPFLPSPSSYSCALLPLIKKKRKGKKPPGLICVAHILWSIVKVPMASPLKITGSPRSPCHEPLSVKTHTSSSLSQILKTLFNNSMSGLWYFFFGGVCVWGVLGEDVTEALMSLQSLKPLQKKLPSPWQLSVEQITAMISCVEQIIGMNTVYGDDRNHGSCSRRLNPENEPLLISDIWILFPGSPRSVPARQFHAALSAEATLLSLAPPQPLLPLLSCAGAALCIFLALWYNFQVAGRSWSGFKKDSGII